MRKFPIAEKIAEAQAKAKAKDEEHGSGGELQIVQEEEPKLEKVQRDRLILKVDDCANDENGKDCEVHHGALVNLNPAIQWQVADGGFLRAADINSDGYVDLIGSFCSVPTGEADFRQQCQTIVFLNLKGAG